MPAAEALAAPADGPLCDDELTRLFAPLAGVRRIALAVSGGPDSLALMTTVDRWRDLAGRKPDVIVLTVDHRLQAGSDRVAEMVRDLAADRGLATRVLIREGAPPRSNVEAAAREARYRLLIDACRTEGATHLVLAHHRDDVAETFLMRLRRGAGVFGLAAMRPAIAAGEVTIVRPFLSIAKSRLEATVAAAGLAPVEDPMNSDIRFARTAARRLLGRGTIDPAVVASVAARMAETADAIEAEAGVLLADAVSVDRYGIAWMDRTAFAVAADEVRARVLARLLIAVGGGIYPPRSDRLANLLAVMTAHGQTGSWKRTLAGAVIQARGGRFVFYRELGRSLPEGRPLSPGASVVWDRRFEVIVGPAASAGLTVGALGEAGRREVGATADAAGQGAPAATLAALPAIRSGQNILAVPHFREPGPGLDAAFRCLVADRLRRPPLFPEFPAG